MNELTNPPSEIKINPQSIASQLVTTPNVYLNLHQDVIVISEDKIRLCLLEHLKRLEKKTSWIIPLSILVPIVVTWLTATFKDAVLKAAVWEAIFIIVGCSSLVWFGIALIRALRAEKLEDIINELRKGALKPEDGVTNISEYQNKPLEILKVTYGTPPNKIIDITDRVRNVIKGGKISFQLTNTFAGDDPDKGVTKKGIIKYRHNDRTETKEYTEGATVNLPLS